MEIFILKNTPI